MRTLDIDSVFNKAKINEKYLNKLGKYKGKLDLSICDTLKNKKEGKLILVTSITPTKYGEGKTTISIALADTISEFQRCMLCLREPSMGPTFGVKGGATGFGASSLFLQDDINLHFTGDFHAINSVTNLVAAVIDNHIFQGNELNIDPNKITWKRSIDVNDRSLRKITTCQDEKCGDEKHAKFVITAASELMVDFVLSKSKKDFFEKVSNIVVAYSKKNQPIHIKDLKIEGAISALMEDAINPNLTMTLRSTPTFIHGGPFANIATGNSSVIATKLGLRLAPIAITEAGFGADLGAQKFLDIVCREGDFGPNLIVLVATIKALKHHGGMPEEESKKSNPEYLKKGFPNLLFHYNNLNKYGPRVLVVLNQFKQDSDEEIKEFRKLCKEHGLDCVLLDPSVYKPLQRITVYKKVKTLLADPNNYNTLKSTYSWKDDAWTKIEKICTGVYHASKVEYSNEAKKQIQEIIKSNPKPFHVCISKVPTAIGDDPTVVGMPVNHTMHIREAYFNSGSNMLVCLTGKIVDLPGLPKVPRAVNFVKK